MVRLDRPTLKGGGVGAFFDAAQPHDGLHHQRQSSFMPLTSHLSAALHADAG